MGERVAPFVWGGSILAARKARAGMRLTNPQTIVYVACCCANFPWREFWLGVARSLQLVGTIVCREYCTEWELDASQVPSEEPACAYYFA